MNSLYRMSNFKIIQICIFAITIMGYIVISVLFTFDKMKNMEKLSTLMPLNAHRDYSFSYNNKHSIPVLDKWSCNLDTCFNFSKCSLSSNFPVFVYDQDKHSALKLDKLIKISVNQVVTSSGYFTSDGSNACLYLVIVGETLNDAAAQKLQQDLNKLAYWNGDGSNHVIINLSKDYNNNRDILFAVDTGKAIVAQSTFRHYREGFDVVISPVLSHNKEKPLLLRSLFPIKRPHLVSFQGEMPVLQGYQTDTIIYNEIKNEKTMIDILKEFEKSYPSLNCSFQFNCNSNVIKSSEQEWSLCTPDNKRHNLLNNSIFTLILSPLSSSILSTSLIQTRVYEALMYGAIPVILGPHVELPFRDMLPWQKAVLKLYKHQVSDIITYLTAMSDRDILEYRRHGRVLWDTYMKTTKVIADTLLSSIRSRLHIPATPFADHVTQSSQNHVTLSRSLNKSNMTGARKKGFTCFKASVGHERDICLALRNRFSSVFQDFQTPITQTHSFSSYPYKTLLLNETKISEGGDFNPLNVAGKYKKRPDEWRSEQFTIVISVYKRYDILLKRLKSLNGVPYLNKIIVICNDPKTQDIKWPKLRIPLHVIRAPKNSLNNRFLPYDVITTDAILSLDDDMELTHEEIVFAFRVWKENPERLVGFPDRLHIWNDAEKSWKYYQHPTCQMSLILTGAAFFSKYYTYMYTYVMPQSIRDHVDDNLNCEDIAMNFLVAHVTRKPPIKVTRHKEFNCYDCKTSLSFLPKHYVNRSNCLNYFVKVYGYMPLLTTQYRADSLLYRTKGSSKCYKDV